MLTDGGKFMKRLSLSLALLKNLITRFPRYQIILEGRHGPLHQGRNFLSLSLHNADVALFILSIVKLFCRHNSNWLVWWHWKLALIVKKASMKFGTYWQTKIFELGFFQVLWKPRCTFHIFAKTPLRARSSWCGQTKLGQIVESSISEPGGACANSSISWKLTRFSNSQVSMLRPEISIINK